MAAAKVVISYASMEADLNITMATIISHVPTKVRSLYSARL